METDIVLLQDIKDVALYNSKIEMLTLEFISYFHTKAMDAFLRSAIIYFQYYLQVSKYSFQPKSDQCCCT